MKARRSFAVASRLRAAKPLSSGLARLFGERLGKKKAWKCTFCGVVGSHRRGCHYVTREHHRAPKPARRGTLGTRIRASRRAARRS